MGQVPKDVDDAFMAGRLTPGVNYTINDAVAVQSGQHKGQTAAVISIFRMDPEPVYLVELGRGGDVEVSQSDLEPIG